MLSDMSTNIELNDELLAKAQELALRTGRTLTAVIEDGLRAELASQTRRVARARISLIKDGTGGLRSGVSLDCTSALIDLMDGSHATG